MRCVFFLTGRPGVIRGADAIKANPAVELVEVTLAHRDSLPAELADRLRALRAVR